LGGYGLTIGDGITAGVFIVGFTDYCFTTGSTGFKMVYGLVYLIGLFIGCKISSKLMSLAVFVG
jgi:hypothetical protein